MSQEKASDLSALDSLFSRYGAQGVRGLSDERKKQIYAGTQQEDHEHSNPTQNTLKAILDYEETIPDQEVDEFITKIRDTRLLDDYPDDNLDPPTTPAYNPWPLDDDTSPVMADPLSGEILVTDLQNKDTNKSEDNDTLDSTAQEVDDPTSSDDDDDIDDEEAEDLTEEFEKERAKEDVSADHHGDGDAKKDDDGDEALIPRIDDDLDKEQSVKLDDVIHVDEEEESEEEKDEEDGDEEENEEKKDEKTEDVDENDSNVDTKDNEVDSRTCPVQITVDSSEETPDNTDGTTVTDGKTTQSESNEASKTEKRPQEKKKESVPDFETFLAELGVDPRETLDIEAQKSRARLSRVGPLAQRRPKTKRSSGGDEDGSKWMFVDSTEPKPHRLSIDEEEEEEKVQVRTPVKAPAPQAASRPGMKKPSGGIGLGPMVLPGLGSALGGSKLKKTPTSSPNKTFQKSIEESKVTASKSEPTRTMPLSSLKKTPPPASKAPPTTASKPLLTKPKPLAKPRPVSQVMPTKEPAQPAWLKELKSKPKPEVKETTKEEEKPNSDILHPKTTSSETTPKTPSWMANSKTKKLPPIPSSSSTPKQEAETSTPNVPLWKQELMKKKKPPAPSPTSNVNKSPVKSQNLPKSPTKTTPTKTPAKPPIARKPGFPVKQDESLDKGSPKPSNEVSTDKVSAKPTQKPSSDKSSVLKREDEGRDEMDSKKIKLSQSMDSTPDEEKMEVTQEMTTEETPEQRLEESEEKDDCHRKDVEMKPEEEDEDKEEEKEEENEEEVKVAKTEEKKIIVLTKDEKSETEERKPLKTEEHKETIVTMNGNSKDTVKENQDEDENKKGGVNLERKKDDKKVKKPVIIPKPKTDKPKIEMEDTSPVKPAKVALKTDSKKEEPKEEKAAEKKVTIVMKSDSKVEDTKKVEQKKVTIVTKTEDKNSDDSGMPKWKREARERMQKRKMSGGSIVPLRSPNDTIETSNNNTPQWKKDLVEKRKLFPRMPSLDSEEKGSVESQKSEKVLKRHTIAADVPTISVPAGHKTGTPTWKQELEKKNARLAKHLATKDAGPGIKPPIDGVNQQPVPELSK